MPDALDALKEHNAQLSSLLTPDGRRELDRLVLLEVAVHAFADGRLSHYSQMSVDQLIDRLMNEPLGDDVGAVNSVATELAADLVEFFNLRGQVKSVGKKIGSVANSYVKKKAGSILGGGDDDNDDD